MLKSSGPLRSSQIRPPRRTERKHSSLPQESMKCLNNRAESHLTGLVEQENDVAGNGAWVNQGFCDTPLPIPRVVSTIYSPNPLFQGSMDSAYRVESIGPLPEAPPPPHTDQSLVKKRRGCCSLIKGQNLQTPEPLALYVISLASFPSINATKMLLGLSLLFRKLCYGELTIMIMGFSP